jgi:uncharacterized protein (DUF1697 family)
MAALRRLARAAGFHDVTTVGASGNVLYSSARTPSADARRLAALLVRRMKTATVVVRTASQMARLVRTAPFVQKDAEVPDKWRFVALLEHPSDAPLPPLPVGSPVRFAGRAPREIFYSMSEPTGHAIAMVSRLERALGTSSTVRNWNVVRDLASRLEA